MSAQLLALLAAYYACDVAAIDNRMPHGSAAQCSATYEEAKMGWLAPDERAALDAAGPGEASRAAFRRFRAWEAANADLVGDLRRTARAGSVLH